MRDELRRRLVSEKRLALKIRVQPKSPHTAWAGVLEDGTLKIRLAAVPEKGKANRELQRFLAKELEVPCSAVEIVSGATSHLKQVRITAPLPVK